MSDITTDLTSQVKTDYLAYSMAVLIGRAIPSLTDGLKPAQRRVLTAMKWLGLKPDGKYMKSARVEGETMGKLHPHSGSYGVMVTLASPWSNNVPLIDGHGNWGSSVDGAAASRYTECKLSPFSWECLLDDADTWVTTDNYDGSLQEPIELNAKIPTVLLNGQDGIGVGFATKIPPHSLRDICDAITKGTPLTPSFPTQCHVVRDEGLDSYVRTGIGSLRLRAKCEVAIEEKNGRKKEKTTVTFTNLPHGTNPEKVGEQIASALEKGTLNGITAVIDESDLSGDRISVTAKSGTDIALLTRQLYHYTDLDTKYSARLLVVDGTKPVELSPSELLARWCNWRMDRLGTKFRHELDASETRLEIVRGYLKAIDKIDTVIAIIRKAASPKEALIELVSNKALKFTGDQARAILEMRLRALTNLDSEELRTEERSLCVRIEELDELVKNEKTRKAYMLKEIKAIGVRHGDANRSELIDPPEGLTVEKGSQNRTAPVSRPKFIKIDTKRGVAEQVKGPRGAIVMEKTDKLVTVTQDGTIKKLPANYKGPLSTGFSPVVLAKKESDVTSRKYLVVFTLEEALKAMVVSGEDLTKVTSKGKSLLPEGATLIHFGEGAYDVPWVSARKKPLKLDLSTKAGRPGAKGIKVAALTEIQL
jgi:DNA gyrase subunit A